MDFFGVVQLGGDGQGVHVTLIRLLLPTRPPLNRTLGHNLITIMGLVLALWLLFAALGAQVASADPKLTHRQPIEALCYDFVVVGGGTSGLTVADRLTKAFPKSRLYCCPFATGRSSGLTEFRIRSRH